MTAVAIPTTPGFVKASPRFLDFSTTLTPPLGGVQQRLQRLGSRFALDIAVAPAREGTTHRALLMALLEARDDRASYPWPQPGLNNPPPGGFYASAIGAGQTGNSLNVYGSIVGYTYRRGQFVSISAGSRRYLHAVRADTVVPTGGYHALPIFPMLRASPANASLIEVAAPVIEGILSGDSLTWEHDLDNYVPFGFTISEVA